MQNLKIFVLLVSACLIISCSRNDPSRTDYSGEIDSLMHELSVMQDSLSTLDVHEVQLISDSLRQFYDTAEIRDTLKTRYELYEKSNNILNWYDNVHREINFSRSHLSALKRDFQSSDLPDSTRQKELRKEKNIIAPLKKSFNEEYGYLKKEMRQLLNRQDIHE